jgi:hypothetical protein
VVKEIRYRYRRWLVGQPQILTLHSAALHPDNTVLFALTLWLDGWGAMYIGLFALVTQCWCADLFWFSGREPFGVKDERVRALVRRERQASSAIRAALCSNWLVTTVRGELGRIRQPH